jgi:hypothetical protein
MSDKTEENQKRYRAFHDELRNCCLEFSEETTITKKHFKGDASFRLWGMVRTEDDKIPVIIWADLDDPGSFKVHYLWMDEPLCEELYDWLKQWKGGR